jgi:hypothetical protein
VISAARPGTDAGRLRNAPGGRRNGLLGGDDPPAVGGERPAGGAEPGAVTPVSLAAGSYRPGKGDAYRALIRTAR